MRCMNTIPLVIYIGGFSTTWLDGLDGCTAMLTALSEKKS